MTTAFASSGRQPRTPETRSSVIDAAIYRATQAEPAITAAVRAAAEATGGHLVDLDTRLKAIDSLVRKVEGRLQVTPAAKPAEVVAGINDLVRYRIVAHAAGYWVSICGSRPTSSDAGSSTREIGPNFRDVPVPPGTPAGATPL